MREERKPRGAQVECHLVGFEVETKESLRLAVLMDLVI